MADSSRPSKPLRILTIDGGGLQAVSTLLILNKLLETIAKENGLPENKKPRPCDVFDTIAGIGAGGWLAILLGRFRMDITTCLTEWFNIVQCIQPKSKIEELRLRVLQHCYFDTERLKEQVDSLTQIYSTDDRLFDSDTEGARTRHVFVAALTSDSKRYKLFRSYRIETAKLPNRLLEGPKDWSTFEIWRAFGVTGAARYFSNPWKEEMETSGKTVFNDTKFPKPHNITELALDEMWAIYGTEVPLSVVVNIGPGLPSDDDVKRIARRFSWGRNISSAHEATSTRKEMWPVVPNVQPDKVKHSFARTNTVGSIKDRAFDAKLRRFGDDIERDIKEKLNNIYPGDSDLYFRLAPAKAPLGTPQNDLSSSRISLKATQGYLREPFVDAKIVKIVNQMKEVVCT